MFFIAIKSYYENGELGYSCLVALYITTVMSSNPRDTSSDPRVRRLKARVARLKARVGRLKARVKHELKQ